MGPKVFEDIFPKITSLFRGLEYVCTHAQQQTLKEKNIFKYSLVTFYTVENGGAGPDIILSRALGQAKP